MKLGKTKRFAKKSLGQNFLVDQNYVEKIIAALDAGSNETIVEIGPGRGALTKHLVEKAEKVFAIEIDRELVPVLQEEFSGCENFHLIEKDALEIDFGSLLALQTSPPKTKLIANLPYYISTAILQHLIRDRNAFSSLVLMLQREVVDRITADTATKERGFLTVLIEAYFGTEKLFDVPPNAFRPAPKIWSSVVRLVPKTEEGIKDDKVFRELVSLGFAQKRKTILNNIKNAQNDLAEAIENLGGAREFLRMADIAPTLRAESLELSKWVRMAKLVSK